MKPKNTICLWFDRDALEAARFYAATFPDSKVTAVETRGFVCVFVEPEADGVFGLHIHVVRPAPQPLSQDRGCVNILAAAFTERL